MRHALTTTLTQNFPAGYGIPHVHIVFLELEKTLKNMAEVFQLDSDVPAKAKSSIMEAFPEKVFFHWLYIVLLLPILTDS